MAESSTNNTRLTRSKTQGQIEDKKPKYCSRSTSVPKSSSTLENKFNQRFTPQPKAKSKNKTPVRNKGDRDEERERHVSREAIRQGKVGSLRNKIEQFGNYVSKHSEKERDKESTNSNGFEEALFVEQDTLLEGLCRKLFASDIVSYDEQQVIGESVCTAVAETGKPNKDSDALIEDNCENNCESLTILTADNLISKLSRTKGGKLDTKHCANKRCQLHPVGYKSKGNQLEIQNCYKASEEENSDSETEVFVGKSKIMGSKVDQGRLVTPAGEEEVVIPNDVSIVDVYKMLATFQKQMRSVPNSLTNLETSVEDMKTRLTAVEANKTMTNNHLNNLENGLQDNSE